MRAKSCTGNAGAAVREFIAGIVRRFIKKIMAGQQPADKNGKLLVSDAVAMWDNPLSNVAASSLRLTDTFCSAGPMGGCLFRNEKTKDIVPGPMLKGPGRAPRSAALCRAAWAVRSAQRECRGFVRNFAIYSAVPFHHAPSASPGALRSAIRGSGKASPPRWQIQAGLDPATSPI